MWANHDISVGLLGSYTIVVFGAVNVCTALVAAEVGTDILAFVVVCCATVVVFVCASLRPLGGFLARYHIAPSCAGFGSK